MKLYNGEHLLVFAKCNYNNEVDGDDIEGAYSMHEKKKNEYSFRWEAKRKQTTRKK
jgi:hypothetical protein